MGANPVLTASLAGLVLAAGPPGFTPDPPRFDGGDGCIELSAQGPRPCSFTFGPPRSAARARSAAPEAGRPDGGTVASMEVRLLPCIPIGPGFACPCEVVAPEASRGRAELRASSAPLDRFLEKSAPLLRDTESYWAAPGARGVRQQLPRGSDAGLMTLRLDVVGRGSAPCPDTLRHDGGELCVLQAVERR